MAVMQTRMIEPGRLKRADLERVDRRLAMLGRVRGALMIRLGDALSEMKRKQGYRTHGVSRFGPYAQQRVQQKQGWIDSTVRLADRLRPLPLLREAVWNGDVLPSMAELVARRAKPEEDAAWVAIAKEGTVRGVRKMIREEEAATPAPPLKDEPDGAATVPAPGDDDGAKATTRASAPGEDEDGDPSAPVVRWVDGLERAAMTAAALRVDLEAGQHVRGNDLAMALLGEAQSSLPPPPLGIGRDSALHASILQRRAETQAEREREEEIAEGSMPPAPERIEVMEESPLPHSVFALDRLIVRVAEHLAALDLEVGLLALKMFRDDAYERIGFATDTQYAKERVGMSLRSLQERMSLARKCRALPKLAEAVRGRRIGMLSARLVGSRAKSTTIEAWLARAAVSTLKHLREDVDAAEAFDLDAPPTDDEREQYFDFERAVLAGRPQMSASARAGGRQPKLPPQRSFAPGRVCIGTTESWRDDWLMTEQWWRSAGSPRGTFMRFATTSLLESHPIDDVDFAFKAPLLRDRYKCSHPMCDSREPGPHHLRFRAHGGTDEDPNIAGLCYPCHIELIHQYLATVVGLAPNQLQWRLGKTFLIIGRHLTELPAAADA